MKRFVTALCALSFTIAVGGAAFADCPGHASSTPTTTTDSKGT